MKEIWKRIPDFWEYEISTFGRIRSLKSNKIKILHYVPDAYVNVGLYRDGKDYTFRVHQLMGITFLGHIPGNRKIVIDHIDNDKHNNRLENLQEITAMENSIKVPRGKSKYPGVNWRNDRNKWRALITINGKRKYLGSFESEEIASKAYEKELSTIILK